MTLPGGEITKRELHFVWIVDCSGSMKDDGKIQSLNYAIREAIPHMQREAENNIQANLLISALRFSTGAQWFIPPTHINDFKWVDVEAKGHTDLGQAFMLLSEMLHIPPMTNRGLPPVLVLLSDGQPTDNYEYGLEKLLNEPWGKKAIRIAIAIGEDADTRVLENFIRNDDMKPLLARNPEALSNYIRWVSTVVQSASARPKSQQKDMIKPELNVQIPKPPEMIYTATEVW
ncbi:vWA domain-containing protein [Candidatus Nitrosocosmicus franklandus]|uniref:von Willebrand factor type A domain protein n=1 Tax=Candidatus Nitrosocosmicus franklandianus TaxID=1798806 RepID=A0A484I7E5_9ARCH|nr:vWA domain-containing protein [Candidatus Nitrosocosmicus franklandus]VFJ13026.1 von Willebrand factor type A domain protein [Candidatus Nitrosocosmicus franklandus]